jgi:inosine/xanthosine triphosphatase
MKVVVGSLTHCKIEAARSAFQQLMPEQRANLEVSGVKVASGVADMPITNEELRQGAINRAKAAQALTPDADFHVGIEGGFATEFGQVFCAGWYAVIYKEHLSVGRSIAFLVPEEIAKSVTAGVELGDVVERISRGNSIRGKEGLVGLLTSGQYTRVEYDTHGVIAALSPLIWEMRSTVSADKCHAINSHACG